VSRSLTLTGRRPVASPRAQAVGSQGGKKSLQARFFAAASPSASALAGFPPKRLTQLQAESGSNLTKASTNFIER